MLESSEIKGTNLTIAICFSEMNAIFRHYWLRRVLTFCMCCMKIHYNALIELIHMSIRRSNMVATIARHFQ